MAETIAKAESRRKRPGQHPQIGAEAAGGIDERLSVGRQAETDRGMQVAPRAEVAPEGAERFDGIRRDGYGVENGAVRFLTESVDEFAVLGEDVVLRGDVGEVMDGLPVGGDEMVA